MKTSICMIKTLPSILEKIKHEIKVLHLEHVWCNLVLLILNAFTQVTPMGKKSAGNEVFNIWAPLACGNFKQSHSQNLSLRPKLKKPIGSGKIDVATSLQPACFCLQSACFRL